MPHAFYPGLQIRLVPCGQPDSTKTQACTTCPDVNTVTLTGLICSGPREESIRSLYFANGTQALAQLRYKCPGSEGDETFSDSVPEILQRQAAKRCYEIPCKKPKVCALALLWLGTSLRKEIKLTLISAVHVVFAVAADSQVFRLEPINDFD